MQEVARFASAEEARVALGYLRARGLTVSLGDGEALGAMPYLGVGLGGHRILATDRDWSVAKRLLADVEAEPAEEPPACPECGGPTRRARHWGWTRLISLWCVLPFAKAKRALRCQTCGQAVAEEPDRPLP